MAGSYKPEGYSSVAPYLITENAERVLEFLREGLGATPLRRFEDDDGGIVHAEVRIDDSVVMLGQAGENWPAQRSHVHVYVSDVDAAYERAVEHGGEAIQAPAQREGDPDRRGGVRDPGGNTWWLGTQMSK